MLVYLAGLFVLLLVAIVASALLTAALFGVMYATHKFAADKFPDSSYENFDFNSITKPTLSEFLLRLAGAVFPATIVLVLLANIFFPPLSPHGFRRHYLLVSVLLWFLETAAIAVGLWKLLKLDPPRIGVFTAAASLLFLFLYWLFLYNNLYM
jgi:hypothetical protein